MKLKKKIELAKVGNWNGVNVTEEMLKQVVSNFTHPVPVRPGHTAIAKGQKADGNIPAISYNNGTLIADIELMDDLADGYNNRKYLSWSADLAKYDNGWNLTAAALLGAEKPGIKGLRELQFSETNQTINIKFTEEGSEMDLSPEQIKAIAAATVEAMKAAGLNSDDSAEFEAMKAENEKLKAELEAIKAEKAKADEKVAEFAEKEKTAAEKAKADHNAAVEKRAAEIAEFNEPESLKFKELFFDKPETAVFMEKYHVEDTRFQGSGRQKLTFSDDKEQRKNESIADARKRLAKERK